jgi:hypothetical protein
VRDAAGGTAAAWAAAPAIRRTFARYSPTGLKIESAGAAGRYMRGTLIAASARSCSSSSAVFGIRKSNGAITSSGAIMPVRTSGTGPTERDGKRIAVRIARPAKIASRGRRWRHVVLLPAPGAPTAEEASGRRWKMPRIGVSALAPAP